MIETLVGRHWHELPQEEVLRLMGTQQEKGLSGFEIKHRLEQFGFNTITVKKKTGPVKRFLLQFHNPLVYILLSAAVVTAVLSEWVDFSVIFGVVLVNAVIGFMQESKAEDALESLRRAVSTEAMVLRDGKKIRIPSQDIVPGDIVLLESGDKVPADLRLLRAREFRVDESALTGESLPVEKKTGQLEQDTVLADRTNMAYSGTLVTMGRAEGVVVGTGDNTETGRISTLISQAVNLETPLTKKIASFSHKLLWIIMGLAVITFLIGLLRNEPVFDIFMAAVALAVGAIPEGLPAAVTITLAIGVNRLAKRRAIIRKLPAVETLGSTTVICSDKTGTLTENKMTVQAVWAGGRRYNVSGLGFTPQGAINSDSNEPVQLEKEPALRECLLAGILCNDSRLYQEEDTWKIQGDATEAALFVSARKVGMNEEEENRRLRRLDTIPFESERQYMATLHDTGPEHPNIVYIKGSVEKILQRCKNALDASGKITELDSQSINNEVNQLAKNGLRILALASKEMGNEALSLETTDQNDNKTEHIASNDVTGNLTFIGLQAMMDPPRAEAMRAVEVCHKAGIRVKMITGDHALTAAAIAEQLGLGSKGGIIVKTGSELDQMSDDELIAAARDASVFARVTPEQKLKLVDALQSLGNVVAMTGDGVNDAPALKQANIGVAMGIAGTEVSKEAADMVLTDDNFATIEAAVEEGRGVFDNLTKFIVWTLPTNLGEGLVILAAIFMGIALPILPVQILWINMTTALLLGLMLAFEPKEPGIMDRPPRNPDIPIITKSMIFRIVLVAFIMLTGAFGFFKWELLSGGNVVQARTVAVNIFVMVELFYLFNCRSMDKSMFRLGVFSNPLLIAGVIIMAGLQILFTYLPAMNRIFGSAPIGIKEWGWIIGFSFLAYSLVETEKWIRNSIRKSKNL